VLRVRNAEWRRHAAAKDIRPVAAPLVLFVAPECLVAQSCVVGTTVAECSSAGYHPAWASAMAAGPRASRTA